MKKIILLLACAAGVLCACTSNFKRSNELIAEYSHKADSVSIELAKMEVVLSPEKEKYIEALALSAAYQSATVVARNWQLTTAWLEGEAMRYTARAELLRVDLSPQEEKYASAYAELQMYKAVVAVLQKWQELSEQ